MSEQKSVEPKAIADELTKTSKPADTQLTEEELSKASAGGGKVQYMQITLEQVVIS
jgi:hypothetical protein